MKSGILILSLTLMLLLNPKSGHSQALFTLADLENLCDSSSADFDMYVQKKGYSFSDTYSNDVVRIYLYKTSQSNGIKDQITRSDFGHGIAMSIDYRTTDETYYAKFKAALANDDFKYEMETPRKIGNVNTIWYQYSNSKYKAIIYSYSLPNGVESYVCSVEKK